MIPLILNSQETGTPDLLDALVSAAIILLILSLITENFTELIRKYSNVVPRKMKPPKTLVHINVEGTDEETRRKKKKEITFLSFIIGYGIALICRANFFEILGESNPQDTLFWGANSLKNTFKDSSDGAYFIFGTAFTGFFLSFGSAFFHDLLEALYNTKEYKRKLINPDTYNKNSAGETIDFINTDSLKIADNALDNHQDKLKNDYPDLVSLTTGIISNGQLGIIAVSATQLPDTFPKKLVTQLNNGVETEVLIEQILDEEGVAQLGPGLEIENVNHSGNSGALGGICELKGFPNKKFVLSCSHVALGGSSKNMGGYLEDDSIQIDLFDHQNNYTEGILRYALIDEYNDTAFIEIDDAFNLDDWDNELPNGKTISGTANIRNTDLSKEFSFYSALSGEQHTGVLQRISGKKEIKIKYDDATVKKFSNVLVIGNRKSGFWQAISEKGDSGAIVYDHKNRAVGLLIGAGLSFSYVLPIIPILRKAKARLY